MDLAKTILDRAEQGPILSFFVLFAALIFGPRIAEKIKLPAMVGLVLTGMAVGPHGFRFMESKQIAMQAWGTFGLLYLMFSAGLELDFKLFNRVRKAAITFAMLSFAIPLFLGVVSAKFLGYAWAAAILMGSNWASHTLVTYPMLREMGLARSKAVATVVGATTMTDTMALLVLTGVSASVGKSGSPGGQVVQILVGLALLGFWTLYALPRLARLFFARVGADRSYRFVFAIAGFLSGAVLSQLAGVDGIVGAFFAGLGLNRDIPERSPLMDRVQFSGSALFIPIFLVSVGLLLNPKVMIDPKTLFIALIFTAAVLGGKTIAAVIAARIFKYTGTEAGVMSGLSGSQAAATLATTIVGARLHLFNEQTVNAVLIVILITLVVTPAVVTHFGRKMTHEEAKTESLGAAVLVPVIGEASRHLFGLAGKLAAADSGIVVAASIAAEDASEREFRNQRSLKSRAEEWLGEEGLESRAVFRVASSIPEGVLQTMLGEGASLLLADWNPDLARHATRESEASRLIAHSPVPMVFASGKLESFGRLVVIARRQELLRPGFLDLQLGAQLTESLSRGKKVLFVGTALDPMASLFRAKVQPERVETASPLEWVARNVQDADLLVFPGIACATDALAKYPALASKAFLVPVAARGVAFRTHQAAASGVVVGRSETATGVPVPASSSVSPSSLH